MNSSMGFHVVLDISLGILNNITSDHIRRAMPLVRFKSVCLRLVEHLYLWRKSHFRNCFHHCIICTLLVSEV